MNLSDRPLAPDPYQLLPRVPSFQVSSSMFDDGAPMPTNLTGDGANTSPDLSWSGFPETTQSFLVNCFDPDAPTPAGFWHWSVIQLPATVTELELGAGTSDAALPAGAFHLRNDASEHRYTGPLPPKGDRPHRYYFAVHALDIPTVPLDSDASATAAAFTILWHTLARGLLVGTYQR